MTGPSMDGSSDLTPLQKQYLRNLRGYCDSPPTVLRQCAKAWRSLALNLVIGALGVGVLVAEDRTTAAWFVGGLFAGVVLRDLGYFRVSAKLWPAIQATLDQKKLEELLGEPTPEADW